MRVTKFAASPRSRQMGGFGFADMLVVLAVLAILLAVTVPMLLKNRSTTQRARCTSNLKEINRAVLQFAEENGGALAFETTKQSGIWWWYKESVKGYLN